MLAAKVGTVKALCRRLSTAVGRVNINESARVGLRAAVGASLTQSSGGVGAVMLC